MPLHVGVVRRSNAEPCYSTLSSRLLAVCGMRYTYIHRVVPRCLYDGSGGSGRWQPVRRLRRVDACGGSEHYSLKRRTDGATGGEGPPCGLIP